MATDDKDGAARASTRERVAQLFAQGLTVTEIAKRLSVSKPTVCHHARRLGRPPDSSFNRRYDWAEVQRYYDAGHTVRQCRARFGFANQTWNNAVKRGDVTPRPRRIPIDELLVAGRLETSRYSLKLRLLSAGLKHGRCEECGLSEWRGKPLSLQLHHVNGDRHDHRFENLRLLCPTATARRTISAPEIAAALRPDRVPADPPRLANARAVRLSSLADRRAERRGDARLEARREHHEDLVAGAYLGLPGGDEARPVSEYRDHEHSLGEPEVLDTRPGRGRVLGHVELDDLELLLREVEQVERSVPWDLVLDQAQDQVGGRHHGPHPEQLEVLHVPRVVAAGDDLLDAVLLARDLADEDVVLVVAGDRDDHVGTLDPGSLEHPQLGPVAVLGRVL